MLIQPDFLGHWKTRLLVEITSDESAPLALIRLWAHCQSSKRDVFPDMTAPQLASVCHWGARKPACHIALIKSGYVEKLKPKGFQVHEWTLHNLQLVQKWKAGEKGGRPAKSETSNEYGLVEKPVGNRTVTDREPGRNLIDQTDPINQIDRKIDRTNQTNAMDGAALPAPTLSARAKKDLKKQFGGNLDGGVEGLIAEAARQHSPARKPTLQNVQAHLKLCGSSLEEYAEAFYETMEKQHWCDREGKQIHDWQKFSKDFASACWRNAVGIGKR